MYPNGAQTSKVYPIELDSKSPLRINEDVLFVLHVLGPNLNPDRPLCLRDNFDLAKKLLSLSYQNILSFYSKQLGYYSFYYFSII